MREITDSSWKKNSFNLKGSTVRQTRVPCSMKSTDRRSQRYRLFFSKEMQTLIICKRRESKIAHNSTTPRFHKEFVINTFDLFLDEKIIKKMVEKSYLHDMNKAALHKNISVPSIRRSMSACCFRP